MIQGDVKKNLWWSLAAAVTLAACGGGGSGGSAPALPPLDVAGAWFGNETASGSAQGIVLTVGDALYGVETEATTVRYFKGSSYSSDGENYQFANARFDQSLNGGATTTQTGNIGGKFVPGTSPKQLFVTSGGLGTAPSFNPMRMDPATANVAAVADLRDFAGRFALVGGSVTLSASSASSGSFSATGLNGCSASGSVSLPRADRNVWSISWTQSGCTDPARNALTSHGLGLFYKSGTTLNMLLLGEDGRAWTLASSSR